MNETSKEMEIRIGTRGSRLAMFQAEWVKRKIEEKFPSVNIELVIIKTTADRIQDKPLYQIGGKGLFLKEIEEALMEKKIDIAVHSMKDVPFEFADVFEIVAITEREDPRDALVTEDHLSSFQELANGATVATGSLRRCSHLLHARPDIRIVPMRGNLDTRLRKFRSEKMDALVLAMAGLRRMNYENIHVLPLDPDICLPAGGQGSFGVEIRRDDETIRNLTEGLNDVDASTCIRAERACLGRLGAECYTSMAAFAEIRDSEIYLRASVADLTGKNVVKDEVVGNMDNPEEIGSELAHRLLSNGAEAIIEEVKRQFGTH